MSDNNTNYRLLRNTGKFITGFSVFLLAIIIPTWLYTFVDGPMQPIELKWGIPVFGLAFGQICRAIADIADRQVISHD
jgi:hypothetical protein